MALNLYPRTYIVGMCCLFACLNSFAQKHTISGYISDAQSGERLIGASVFDAKSKQGTVSNTYGFYSLTLPADSVVLNFSYVGYGTEEARFLLQTDHELNIQLENAVLLEEVEIVGERAERITQSSRMSTIEVPIEQIKHVPAMMGEVDVLKVLQLLPGVASGGEGQTGIYVRGGGPDQNLILLDGVPVYNATHLFGFFSVFNADAIKDVSLVKGGFPARYGGRLSSVIDISLKDGHEKEWHGAGSIGLIASKLTLEGPIQKGKSSVLLSARRTYLDVLMQPIVKAQLRRNGQEGQLGYYFYDLNAKANYQLSPKDRLYLSFYGGKDKFYQNTRQEETTRKEFSRNGFFWGNLTTALRWNHEWNNKLFSNVLLTRSNYRLINENAYRENLQSNGVWQEELYDLNYESGIKDWAFKIDFDFIPQPKHYLKFGASAIQHNFFPGDFRTQSKERSDSTTRRFDFVQPTVHAWELDAYVEDDWKISDRLRVNFGLHSTSFPVAGQVYSSLQPRFNFRYLLHRDWALKGAYSQMRQFIHLLTNESIGLPTDLWLPTTAKIKPQQSWQTALGIAHQLKEKWEISLEAYYKRMDNIIAYKEGSSLFEFSDWENRITQGTGEAYGMEFLIQKKAGRFSGWLGYTLSWAWRQLDEVNLGRKYPFRYDRRHDIEVTGTYEISERTRLSVTWVYNTGNAVTLGTSQYAEIHPALGTSSGPTWDYFTARSHVPERNNFRYPAYHRFDIGFEFNKEKKHHTRTWSFGAYNAYNQANTFYLSWRRSGRYNGQTGETTRKTELRSVALFPIVPYLAYGFKF